MASPSSKSIARHGTSEVNRRGQAVANSDWDASPPQPAPSTPTGSTPPWALQQLQLPGTPVLPPPSQLALPAGPYPAAPAPIHPTRARRLRYYVAAVLFALLGGIGGFWLAPRAGVLQLSVKPPDARVAVDGVTMVGGPLFKIERRAGVHRLAISRTGYDAFERDVLISARQKGHLDIDLVPSADTGFYLTGTPPGAVVWLDGRALALERGGGQANGDLRATRIAPGPHVVEVRGDQRSQPWQTHFVQEPGRTVVLHANLAPVPAAETGPGSTGGKSKKLQHRSPRPALRSSSSPGDDPFEKAARGRAHTKSRPLPAEDIFDNYGRRATSAADCVATISSSPWAELLIDGKTTGKLTPLVNYPLSCGTHRLTFKNEDLMIERNERVTLVPGRPFKKIFQLVPDDL